MSNVNMPTSGATLPPGWMRFRLASLPWCMLCDALPDSFKGSIFNCEGSLVETLAAHIVPAECIVYEEFEGARRAGMRTNRVQHMALPVTALPHTESRRPA